MRQKTENYINVNLKVSLKNTQINRVPSNLIQKKKKKRKKAKNIRNETVFTSTDPHAIHIYGSKLYILEEN